MRPTAKAAILLFSVCLWTAPRLCLAEPPSKKADTESARQTPTDQSGEKKLKSDEAKKKVDAVEVKTTEQNDEEGVKTFKFGAVEVEGRLKAPQILYFLRRVRAEFRAGLLGHRSFMPELMHTRHHPALR
jgi:hypothetical protein